MHLRSLPHTLRSQANRLRFFLGCILLLSLERIHLHGLRPTKIILFIIITICFTLLTFSLIPSHPMRFATALGLGLAAGVIVRTFEVVLERT